VWDPFCTDQEECLEVDLEELQWQHPAFSLVTRLKDNWLQIKQGEHGTVLSLECPNPLGIKRIDEAFTTLNLGQKTVFAIAERNSSLKWNDNSLHPMIRQLSEPATEFLVLSDGGIEQFLVARPVDSVAGALVSLSKRRAGKGLIAKLRESMG